MANWTRYLGASALLAIGLDHLDQYAVDHYSAVPTIGPLFALNAATAILLAAALAAPVHRLAGRGGRLAVVLLGAGGVAVAAGSLAGLLISESTGLFGFMEAGYRPAIILAIALDVVTLLLLAAHVGLTLRGTAAAEPARDLRRAEPGGRKMSDVPCPSPPTSGCPTRSASARGATSASTSPQAG